MARDLTPNPQLPQHPLGAYTDSLYEAQRAQLEQEIQSRYADILQQLGYQDPKTGQHIQGLVEMQADRQRTDLGTSLQLARQGVDQQSQRDQNLFSGYRGTQIAQSEHPFVQALARMNIDVPQQLSTLYEHAGGLLNEYNTRHNVLLAEAAGRYVPSDPGSGGGGGSTRDPGNPVGPGGDSLWTDPNWWRPGQDRPNLPVGGVAPPTQNRTIAPETPGPPQFVRWWG